MQHTPNENKQLNLKNSTDRPTNKIPFVTFTDGTRRWFELRALYPRQSQDKTAYKFVMMCYSNVLHVVNELYNGIACNLHPLYRRENKTMCLERVLVNMRGELVTRK